MFNNPRDFRVIAIEQLYSIAFAFELLLSETFLRLEVLWSLVTREGVWLMCFQDVAIGRSG